MGWSTTPTLPASTGTWTTTPPELATPSGVWKPGLLRRGIDGGAGTDAAGLDRLALPARDQGGGGDSLYMGLDPLNDFEIRVHGRDNAGGKDHAVLAALKGLHGKDQAGARDTARPGLYAREPAGGHDLATIQPRTNAHDLAGSTEKAATKPRVNGRDNGGGIDTATSFFGTQTAVTHIVTSSGHILIPPWCRYIDVIIDGGGKGGQAGSLLIEGKGGTRGGTNSARFDRGTRGNLWKRVYFDIGAGGAAGLGSALQAGGNGGATKFYIDDITDTWIGASGYLETNGATNAAGGRSGESMPNTTFNGMTLNGGAGSNGTGVQPGAGGGGGSAGIGTRNGSPGAPGGAMVRFSM